MTELSKQESSAIMKLILAVLVVLLVVGAQAQWYNFPGDAIGGAKDMWHTYEDLKESNWIDGDKYFHARGNYEYRYTAHPYYEAANRGPGGKLADKIISDTREAVQFLRCSRYSDSEADQEANRWGREGRDPTCYRPKGLPDKY